MDQHRDELEQEGVEVRPDFTVNLEIYQWWPESFDIPGDIPGMDT
jgi:hypothetical protein